MKKNINNKFKNRGFTLVETLVAISILSLSILGTFTAVQNGLQNSTYVKDQTTAFYLVQDAMEYIRNIRDQNALASISSIASGGSGVDWLHGLSENSSDPCWYGSGNICKVDSRLDLSSNSVTLCGTSVGSCPVLNQDANSSNSTFGLFGYTAGWKPSRFKREIQFQNISVGKEVLVTVTISWGTKSFQVKQLFLNNR